MERLKSSIAVFLHEHNRVVAAQNALPDELLCMVFQHLPMADRFGITRVCRDWRSSAIDCPTLWTEVEFYASTHENHCDCDLCEADERNATCDGCGRRVPDQLNNLDAVRTLISRSAQLPLMVDITVLGKAQISEIAKMLWPIAPRIQQLHLTLDEPELLGAFFRHFDALPMLRALVVFTGLEQEQGDLGDGGASYVFLDPLQLPSLHHIEIEGPYWFDRSEIFNKMLPAAEFLRVPVNSLSDIGRSLRIAGLLLRRVHFQINDEPLDETPATEIITDVRQRLNLISLDSIIISDLYETDTLSIVALLHVPAIPDIWLRYRSDSPVSPEALQIFQDVLAPTSISWQADGEDSYTLTVANKTGHKRRLTYFTDQLELPDDEVVWGSIATLQSVEIMVIDGTIWQENISSLPPCPSLGELTICFWEDIEFYDVLVRHPNTDERWVTTSLSTIRLKGTNQTSPNEPVSVSDIISFVQSLQPNDKFKRIRLLEVTGIVIASTDDLSLLFEVAESVEVDRPVVPNAES